MLGFFPTPYPDELLYSLCARYGEAVGYRNRNRVVIELFGSQSAALVDPPLRLNTLLSQLPHSSYDLVRMVHEHTLFRFYAPFSLSQRLPLILSAMGNTSGSRSHHRRPHIGNNFKASNLRFCGECACNDRQAYGETYWHRAHQLTGITVCADHGSTLESANIKQTAKLRNTEFFSAELNIPVFQSRRTNQQFEYSQIQTTLAAEARWLLDYRGDPLGLSILRDRYHNLLLAMGYSHYNGHVKMKYFLDSFVSFYSDAFLSTISCGLKYGPTNWLSGLLSRDNTRFMQHPIRHLLLINFLGKTVRQLMLEFSEYEPFGSGPWPCKNKAADHFGKLLIKDCRVLDSQHRKGTPFGIFSCDCGYAYTCYGVGQSNDYQHDAVISYGPIWEEELRKLWKDRSISLREAGARLGVSELTVVRYALRLKLPVNSPGARIVGEKTVERYRRFRPLRDEAKRIRREAWTKVQEKHPDFSRSELIKEADTLYLWLRRYDSIWLESHLPAARPCTYAIPKKGKVDWESADSTLSLQIENAANRIMGLLPPVRVSTAEIIREVGHKNWIWFAHKVDRMPALKLPRTLATLSKHLESLVEFQVRKLEWATQSYREQRTCPTRSQLIRKARINNNSGKTSHVQKKLNAMLADLSKGTTAFQRGRIEGLFAK